MNAYVERKEKSPLPISCIFIDIIGWGFFLFSLYTCSLIKIQMPVYKLVSSSTCIPHYPLFKSKPQINWQPSPLKMSLNFSLSLILNVQLALGAFGTSFTLTKTLIIIIIFITACCNVHVLVYIYLKKVFSLPWLGRSFITFFGGITRPFSYQ